MIFSADSKRLMNWLASRLIPPVEAEAAQVTGPSLIVVERGLRDPECEALVVSLLSHCKANLFEWTSEGAEGAPAAPNRAIIDLRDLIESVPSDEAGLAAQQQEIAQFMHLQKAALKAGRNVLVITSWAALLPDSWCTLPARAAHTPLITGRDDFLAALKALLGAEAVDTLSFDQDDEVWFSRLLPSDFFHVDPQSPGEVLQTLRERVEARFAELHGDGPDCRLEQFERIGHVRQWADEISALVHEGGAEEDWLLASRGAFFTGPDDGRHAAVATAIAQHANLTFAHASLDTFLQRPAEVVLQAAAVSPALLYLQGAAWLNGSDDDDAPSALPAWRPALIQVKLAAALQCVAPEKLVICIGTPSIDGVPDGLRVPGLLDRAFHLPAIPRALRAQAFLEGIPPPERGETLLGDAAAQRIGVLLEGLQDDAAISRIQRHLRRSARRRNGPVELEHVFDVFLRGTIEDDQTERLGDEARWPVAYHEAGHAVATMLLSDGKDIPDYSTIVPHPLQFEGAVLSTMVDVPGSQPATYKTFRKRIGILLAGRAAEEIYGGPESISTGSASDLAHATRMAKLHFSRLGFGANMRDSDHAGANLCVALTSDEILADERRISAMTRRFLADSYVEISVLLRENQALLDQVAARLMSDPVVDREEMQMLFAHQRCRNAS